MIDASVRRMSIPSRRGSTLAPGKAIQKIYRKCRNTWPGGWFGNQAVHHVIVFVQEPGTTRAEGRLLVGFAPGEDPAIYSAGYARRIPSGSNSGFQIDSPQN